MPKITSLNLKGYRLFRDFSANFGDLEVIVGTNGSGKSALFEFLKFLRDGMNREIPPEIIEGTSGRELFHHSVGQSFEWNIEFNLDMSTPFHYDSMLKGPVGRPEIPYEYVLSRHYSPDILDLADYQKIAEACPQCFKPFVEFLSGLSLTPYPHPDGTSS